MRLKSHTGDPLAIAAYGPLIDAKRPLLHLKIRRQAPGGAPEMLVVRVDGVATREAAEALNRVELFIARDKLPPTEDEDEFLLADLIGCAVVTESGADASAPSSPCRISAAATFSKSSRRQAAPRRFLPFTQGVRAGWWTLRSGA